MSYDCCKDKNKKIIWNIIGKVNTILGVHFRPSIIWLWFSPSSVSVIFPFRTGQELSLGAIYLLYIHSLSLSSRDSPRPRLFTIKKKSSILLKSFS